MEGNREEQLRDFFSFLQKERIARSITLETIADKTRINIRFLNAIEEANIDLLHDVYVRIFIRNYIGQIGLDAEKYLTDFDRIRDGDDESEKTPEQNLAEIDEGPGGREEDRESQSGDPDVIRKAVPLVGALILIFFIGYFVVGKVMDVEPDPLPEDAVETVPLPKPVPRVKMPARVARVPEPESAAVSYEGLNLEVRALNNIWVLISRDDVDTLVSGFLEKGSVSQFRSRDNFFVKIGLNESRFSALSLLLNGNDLGEWGSSGTRLTKFRITNEGVDRTTLISRRPLKPQAADSTTGPPADVQPNSEKPVPGGG